MMICRTEPSSRHVRPREDSLSSCLEEYSCKRNRGSDIRTSERADTTVDLGSLQKCLELRAFLVEQFHQRMGQSPTGGPNSFEIEIADIPLDMFVLLTGRVVQQEPSVRVTRPSTCQLLSISHLDSVQKQGFGGFFRPCPTCTVKYDTLSRILSIRGYTEFIPG